MKKTLLFFAVVVIGISLITAQSVKNVASNKGKATHAKVSEMQTSKSINVPKAVILQKTIALQNRILLRGNNVHSKRMAIDNKMTQTNHVGNFKSLTPLLKMKASKDTTFYEGFESFNGTTLDWIPANWTELVKNTTTYVTGDSINPTWSVNPENSYAFPSIGNSMAWVDREENSRSQDVWLVSPALIPVSGDYINFDFFYNPYWMYIDYSNSTNSIKVFNFTKANATMQFYVSVDNGTNWVKVWDAIDDAGQFNNTNILKWVSGGSWNTIQKSMEAYVGQSIKIAFRYVGEDGDSMGLDNVGVRQLLPAALYARPEGFFYLGYTPDYYEAQADLMLGHAYQSATWYNYSNQDSKSFIWSFEDPNNSAATITSTEIHPAILYPYGQYKIPSLKATVGKRDSIYKWGTSTSGASFIAGGNPAFSWGTLGAGNFDKTAGFANYRFAANDYCFGTGPNYSVDAIANYFDKPAHRYLLDSIWINLGKFAASAGTEFKLTIRRVVDGHLADTIATSVCTTEDVNQYTIQSSLLYTMPFKGFITIDPSTKLEVINDYLEISDAIFVELSGFNIPNVTLSAFCQITDTSYGESNAYVYYKNGSGANDRILLGGYDYIGSTSLLFNLGITYSYIDTPDTTFVAPIAGGNKTIVVDSWYSPDEWWLDAALPEWLTSEQTFNSETWAITYTLKAAALPAGVTGRGTMVKVNTYGAEMNLKVTQGDYTGLSTATASSTQVINNGNSFDVSYTSDFNTVAIYNTAGQLISKFELPTDGKLTIPANNMQKGIYLFSFNGKNTETRKVIR